MRLLTHLAFFITDLIILSFLVIPLSIVGLLLDSGPIIQLISLFVGSAFLGAFSGYFLQKLIMLLTDVRRTLSREWRERTPPYADIEKTGLPVPQESNEKAKKNIKSHLTKLAVLYLINSVISIYVAVERPELINQIANSDLPSLIFLTILAIIQIPAQLLTKFGIVPTPSGRWNWAIVILLIGIPLPLHAVVMRNVEYVLRRFYSEQLEQVIEKMRSESDIGKLYLLNSTEIFVLLSAGLSIGFISSILYVNW